ncbi:hypothetical protein I4U23_010501 [Adineta vaga]|nr:hypothetical protein I4U23_010501 [Adineta vaga]
MTSKMNEYLLLIKSWLNPTIQKKVKFMHSNEELSQYIDPSVLPKRLNALAEIAHRNAVRSYLDATLLWANGDETRRVLSEKRKARKELRNTFEELSPYMSTRTVYHRLGVIKEPIFELAYEQLKTKKRRKWSNIVLIYI